MVLLQTIMEGQNPKHMIKTLLYNTVYYGLGDSTTA